MLKLIGAILLIVSPAVADELKDAESACLSHRHLVEPRIGVAWDKGWEHCALDEAFYSAQPGATVEEKDAGLTTWRKLSEASRGVR